MSKIYCNLELNTLNFHSELAGAKVALEDFNAANAEIIERKTRPSRWSRLWSRVAGFFNMAVVGAKVESWTEGNPQ
mgnify:CR=1 FL=1